MVQLIFDFLILIYEQTIAANLGKNYTYRQFYMFIYIDDR